MQRPTRPANVWMAKLAAEADDLGSVVQTQANTPWIWLAMATTTRQRMALPVGDRRRGSAQTLWAKLPAVSQQHATFPTDPYDVSNGLMPAERHNAITKQARQTHHIEPFTNTLRPRLARLGRATLSFSQKVENHIGAITFFICHYNLEKGAAVPV